MEILEVEIKPFQQLKKSKDAGSTLPDFAHSQLFFPRKA